MARGLDPRLGGQRELLGAGLQLAQGAGEGQRVAGELGARGVGLVLPGAADGELDEAGGERAQDHDQQHAEQAGAVVVVRPADGDQPGEVDQEHDHRGEGAGDGGDQDVAVVDVAQFVADDPAQLALVEQAQDALGAAHGRVTRVAAGGERVGRLGRGDVQAGHGLAGLRGQLADHPVQRRGLELADRAGAHRAQRQLVAVPVGVRVRAQRDQDGHDQSRPAEEAADDDDERGQSPEEYCGPEPVVPAVHGTPSKSCSGGTLWVQWTLPLWSTPGGGREFPGACVGARRPYG
ncbi:putative protein-tyrosine phosphatase [Streptomyces collinus Tu 365]|uniref:Uncharacterized protein n=1 Tax=Streptomyces collinus (strain DSM 40733 / Tue 365) TaxID=1214242 RepID=S5UZG1_STRC3|nr:putative protein-tyrosine phosphatase [Streptomyces collinus Tu 365]